MKISDYLKRAILLPVLLFFSCQTCPDTTVTCVRCEDVAARGYINILDINVLFKTEDMDKRFKHIADFAAENDVDVILLQEIVGGSFAGTDNSAQDLREILRTKHNLDYNISTAWEIGEPNIFSGANAILSRCEITDAQVKRLPRVSELPIRVGAEKKAISFRRNLQMIRINIPEIGKINVYNTHVCARCDIEGRAKQVDALLEFIDNMEAEMPGVNQSVLGGDFNCDRFDNEGAEKFLWEKVVNNGFIDAYADFIISNSGGQETLETLCEDEDNADEHCTVGVSKLDGNNARRVDYVFAKSGANIRRGRVVFNELVNGNEPSVSDHAGIFISLDLP